MTTPERRLVLRPEAEREIAEAAEWYEERQVGLDREFLDAVDACVALVLQGPERYPIVRGPIRRAVLHRFPYNLLYSIRPRELVVLGCVHGRRDGSVWQHRT